MNQYLLIALLCFISNVFAAITADIEPSQINLGDSLQLTLTIDGISPNQTPDLLPLQHDFEITSTQRRVSTTIINGNMQTVNQWGLTLIPKRAGTLKISPIKIGDEQSNPLEVEVLSQGAITTNTSSKHHKTIPQTNKRLYIDTKINTKEPYVNQEILFTVKLIHQDQLLDANYQPPTLEDALILPLGESEQYQVVEDNQIFTVEEQRYALFAQKPGEQIITSPNFQALVYRGMPQRINIKGKQTQLKVKPIPKTIHAKQWIPAKAITLTETYDAPDNTFKIGTTLVRTIKIEARALPAELLPTLKALPNKQFGVYPEKPISKNSIHKQDVAGIKTLQISYLLNQPGTITIPSYTLTWFNTTTGKEEVVSLPAKTIEVVGKKLPTSKKTPTQEILSKPTSSTKTNHTAWIIVFCLSILWIITIIGLLFYKKRPRKKHGLSTLTSLQQACQQQETSKARSALIAWAQTMWPEARILNLDDIKKHIEDEALKNAITHLSSVLYCKNNQTIWASEELWHCVKNFRKKPKKAHKKATLPTINPRI